MKKNTLSVIILTVLDMVFIVFWSIVAIRRFRSRNIPREMVLLYSGEPPLALEEKLKHYQYKFKVRKHVEVSGGFEDVVAQLDDRFAGGHGDILETSVMMAIDPETVHMEKHIQADWFAESSLQASAEFGKRYISAILDNMEGLLFGEI